MNNPNDDKNIVYWNDQPLDTWRDIIVSFEYARYAFDITPTGGFAVLFFDSLINQPRYGGRDYSLGYAPNNTLDYCLQFGYKGLQGAFLGVGFDNYGFFAIKQPYMNGIPVSALKYEPTVAVRDGIETSYNLLYASSLVNLISSTVGASNFTVGQKISAYSEIKYRAVRIILSRNATWLEVQVKDDVTLDGFKTIVTYNLPEKTRKSLKVGLAFTTAEGNTKFDVRNFNVAGYPGIPTKERLGECVQHISQQTNSAPGILSMGDEHISTAEYGRIATYTSDTLTYSFKNNVFTGAGITMLGDDDRNIIVKYDNSSTAGVFTFLGEKLARTATFVTPDNSHVTSGDISGDTLAICTQNLSGSVFIYTYATDPEALSQYGQWLPYQTITPENFPPGKLNGVLGNSVQIKDRNLLIADTGERVHAFRKDVTNTWNYIQTLTATLSSNGPGTTGFGRTIALDKDDAVIGAPISYKAEFPQPGQGEAYHYVFNTNSNQWSLAMALGSFYKINTPGGNFGSSIKLDRDYAVIGSPGEVFVVDYDQQKQIVNVGRAYIFRKTTGGLFSQAAVITPPDNIRLPDMYFGNQVAINGNLVGILSPFSIYNPKSIISIYRLDCEFAAPPIHLPIPSCALVLIDNSGFIIDMVNNNYMVSYGCLLGYPLGDGP